MQYAKLKNDILAARERRDEELKKLLATLAGGSIIQLALNVPGCDKRPAGSDALFGWGQEQLNNAVAPSLELFDVDALGPWVLYASPGNPIDVKMQCCRIEDYRDFARLLDFDVYAADGTVYDRQRLGLPQRSCLVCAAPARECIRTRRHTPNQVKERFEELLEPFTTAGVGRVAYRRAQG